MKKCGLVSAGVLAVLGMAGPARADDTSDWLVEAEAQAGLGLTHVLVRNLDGESSHFGQGLLGVMARGAWQVSPGLWVGTTAGYAWLPNAGAGLEGRASKNHDQLITFLADARLPLTDDLHMSASLGTMLWRETQAPASNAATQVVSQWAAAGAIALGWDFVHAERFTVGLETRCLISAFRRTSEATLGLGHVAWLTAGLTVGFRP